MCRSVSVGGGVVCRPVHVSICDTFNAAGPHSPSGMWDFQVENRACRGRNNSGRREEVGEKKVWRAGGGVLWGKEGEDRR